jgi:hypothetical protein
MTEPQNDDRERSYFDSSGQPGEPSPGGSDDALFEPGPAAQAVGDQTRYSIKVGEGDAERRFFARTPEEAEVQLTAIRAYCRNCPIRDHCPEAECAVYRAETTALATAGRARGAYAGVVLPYMTEDR